MRFAFISLMCGQRWGGSEVLWSKTADHALNEGHSVFISVYKWETMPKILVSLKNKGAIIDFRERYDPNQPFAKKLLYYFKNKNKIEKYKKILSFKPDHVYINQGSNFDIAVHHYDLYKILNSLKIPYSIICHSHPQFSFIPDDKIFPRARDIFINACNVFFISAKQKKVTEKALLTKLSNAEFTWNPLNVKTYDYISWPESKTIQFAVVGSLISGKGQDIIIEILAQKKWIDRDWHLNIYGEGYGKSYLNELVKWSGLDDRVTFYGHVRNINAIWGKNHILLVPSSAEGLSISLCEAMICGRPAVLADVGGNIELVCDYKTGFIAEAPSASSFDKALNNAWEKKRNWKNMGEKASKFMVNKLERNPEQILLNKTLKQLNLL